jgi:hypothetical protein
MSMVCPQCKQSFEKNIDCPSCGCRLMFQLTTYRGDMATTPVSSENDWPHTPWGRIVVGLLLAQGLAYGVQHLFTAGFLASDESLRSVWMTLWGLVLLHVLQGMSLMVGACLSGAGQHQGTLYGSLIGLIHGLIFLFIQRQSGQILTPVVVYGQPILFAAFGTLGGRIGMLIWQPTPIVDLGGNQDSHPSFSWAVFSPLRFFAGPVHLGRVLVGMLIVIIGVLWSNMILTFILDASGILSRTSHLQDRLLVFEISALATLMGAGLAGATTFNGLKQGLCVGIGSSVILVGIQLGSPKAVLETTLFMILSTMILTLAGGWFGGQLFPPILQKRRRKIFEC